MNRLLADELENYQNFANLIADWKEDLKFWSELEIKHPNENEYKFKKIAKFP